MRDLDFGDEAYAKAWDMADKAILEIGEAVANGKILVTPDNCVYVWKMILRLLKGDHEEVATRVMEVAIETALGGESSDEKMVSGTIRGLNNVLGFFFRGGEYAKAWDIAGTIEAFASLRPEARSSISATTHSRIEKLRRPAGRLASQPTARFWSLRLRRRLRSAVVVVWRKGLNTRLRWW